ncbi:alpha/beta hydrolase fold domain-containing protein [Mariniflexile sp. AS56]|uniref:alpha/beta hydrolase fold domain-containing protein n=1 Tax=Mariniflexile sp. AS56 TaxID=3063957 RepID=UPI0026EA55A6|nr:alpha/beta hydrolase fold domain-containing protein [Mariniflexile sp. AS56]MDO7172448.1 alpha/beta hydrolase fold domain-containing protein [Mariniflexile sp. AS56]
MRIIFSNKINHRVSTLLALSFLFLGTLEAQDLQTDTRVDAKREFSKLDNNKNGVLEVAEVIQIWKLLRKYDSDNNKKLTLEEYSNFDIPYLKTKGDIELNVKYKTTKEEDLYLDIYYPSQKSEGNKYPIVFYTHGGGWFNGSKENIVRSPVAEPFLELVEQGFAVVSINYRLTRSKSVLMRDCVIDAMDALRYLSKNSDSLKLDANQVFVLGDSAGGHIAQMLLLANPDDFKGDKKLYGNQYKVIAGVSWYGPSDFTIKELFETDDAKKEADRFSSRITKTESNPSKMEAMYKEMSPILYLTKESPPLFMMAADNDTTIPVGHAYHIKKKADEIGANVEIFIVKNAGHNWRKAGGPIDPTLEVITKKTVDFILKYN